MDQSTQPLGIYRTIIEVGLTNMDKLAKLSDLEKIKNESNVGRRIKALEYLGRSKDKKSLDLIHATLKNTIHPTLRVQCINALVRMNDEESLRIIENVLIDKDKFVENGLKLIDETQNSDPKILKMLPKKDEYIEVKAAAAWALGVFNRKKSINQLFAALEDKELEVRVNAAYSLGELADPGEMNDKPANSVAAHLNDLLGKFNDQNAHPKYRVALAYPVLKLLKVADAEIKKNEQDLFLFLANALLLEDDFSRSLSIRVLGKLKDLRGLLPLEYIIARERSAWVSQEISRALYEIKIFNRHQK
jgi:HEAT repeat protein